MHYVYLLLAIVFEVAATSALNETDGFTRPAPSVLTLAGYGLAFYFLSLAMRVMPVGIVYALWAGVGMVLIALVGWLVFRQPLDLPAIAGIGLILAGVVVLNVFSTSVPR